MIDGLLAADGVIRATPDLAHTRSLLVAHRDQLFFERYYGPAGPDDLHDIHSVTKSITSTVVGILAGEGQLSLDAPLAAFLRAPAFTADPAKRAITVRHLLTMTSGLDHRGDEERAIDAPLVAPPGEAFAYNNGASHILSAVVQTVTGMPLADVAAERLFAPLGIERWEWPADAHGRSWACGGLRLRPRDLLKIGLLYLHGGRWKGARVVDEAYAAQATSPLNAGGPPERCSYGLLWWVAPNRSPALYFAGGHGGQYVVVVPELDLVAMTVADAGAAPRPKGSLLRALITWVVVPAVTPPRSPQARGPAFVPLGTSRPAASGGP